MSENLLFTKGSYLMVSIDYLPISPILDNLLYNSFNESKYHITIAYEPKKTDTNLYLNYLDEDVIVKTKSISIGYKGIARIDIEYMKYLNGIELKRINTGCPHISLIIPPYYKAKDTGYFQPNQIIEFDEILIGKYQLYQ